MESPSVLDSCPATGAAAQFFLTLINALTSSKCLISSISNYPPDYSFSLTEEDEFDFIIIGGGSAGSVVANKLSENSKWRILVLEAGTYPSFTSEVPALFFSLQETDEDWQYSTEPSDKACLGFKDKKCLWPRGKALGGSSTINAMLYVRGNRKDYDQWAQHGNDGWNYESVKQLFTLSEKLESQNLGYGAKYGNNGDLILSSYHLQHPIIKAIKTAAVKLGYPSFPEEGHLGYYDTVLTIDHGERANAGKMFLGKVQKRKNLMVALNSKVETLIIDNTKTVKGVTAIIAGKKINLKASNEVIVSAGAINSPQILMLSGIGPKQHLEDLGVEVVQDLSVGKNLQDHLVSIGFMVKLDDSAVKYNDTIDEIYRYFAHQEGILAQIGATNLMGFINTKQDSDFPNLQFHHVLNPKNDTYALPQMLAVFGLIDEVVIQMIKANQQFPTIFFVPTLLHPKSRGQIFLNSTNSNDKPIINANYFDDPADMETLLEGIKFLKKLLKTEPIKKYNPRLVELKIPGCEDFEFGSDGYWRCSLSHLASTIYHPVGTCKMGLNRDFEAVVDSKLRVHGVKNLRVIDASIMPNITSGNTNAPTLMIGQNGGSIVAEDWKIITD